MRTNKMQSNRPQMWVFIGANECNGIPANEGGHVYTSRVNEPTIFWEI
jgi:hypothetical protein